MTETRTINVTTCTGRFEAEYVVAFSNSSDQQHDVKVITRTGNRTIKPHSKIWNKVVMAAYEKSGLLRA